ncbi:MAG TPA: hypothetical protein VNI78_05155, partial [Vicinamibacterales bacterium]|nr:hypothetical protein [Vicinamibacterales bacterium]
GGDAPILFYSRRIGLNQNRQVPLEVGGRLTGRAGAYSIGLINIQTGDEPESGTRPTNFTVMRLRRDILARSAVGLMFTKRSIGADGGPGNRAYGADATFNFYENLQINTYWAKTDTPGLRGRDTSYRTQLDYQGDRYTVQLDRLAVGERFNPGIGFVRRHDMIRNMGRFRFTPRPRQPSIVRKYSYEVSLEYVTDGEGRLESRDRQLEFGIDFQNADRLEVRYNDLFEFLPVPSVIGSVLLPVGAYRFDNIRVQYDVSQQRPVSGNVAVEYGTFYNGRKTTVGVGRGRIPLTTQLSVEPTYSLNRVRLVQGNFTAHLAGSRITFTPTPLMFVSALLQYNSSSNSLSTNARFRWEYRPGSELFVVYNEERDTLARSFPALANRAFIVKVNRLLRF